MTRSRAPAVSGDPIVVMPPWSDAAGWNQAPYYSTVQLGDVNGDGKLELLGSGAMENYIQASPVSGTSQILAVQNDGALELFTVSTGNELFNVYPDTTSDTGWSQVSLGVAPLQVAGTVAAGPTPEGPLAVFVAEPTGRLSLLQNPAGSPTRWGPPQPVDGISGVVAAVQACDYGGQQLWLGFLFDWPDILRTKDVVKYVYELTPDLFQPCSPGCRAYPRRRSTRSRASSRPTQRPDRRTAGRPDAAGTAGRITAAAGHRVQSGEQRRPDGDREQPRCDPRSVGHLGISGRGVRPDRVAHRQAAGYAQEFETGSNFFCGRQLLRGHGRAGPQRPRPRRWTTCSPGCWRWSPAGPRSRWRRCA
jgi:hypothetical protein